MVLALKKSCLAQGMIECAGGSREPGGAMSYKKNMGLNYKLPISKAITDPVILKDLEAAQFNHLLLAMLMILPE